MESAGPSSKHSDVDESQEICTPEEITEAAKQVTLNLLPDKSREKYNAQYKLFIDWCATKKVKKYTESVILTYLSNLSQKFKVSTLWSIHSMLKTTLSVKNNVDIGNYCKVTAFWKKKSVGYVSKKSKMFTQQDISAFLRKAPDEIYLMDKVVLIIGVAGACRTDELTNMTIDSIIDKNEILIINIPDTKNNKQRRFTVCNSDKENSVDILSICKKYFNLRPKNMNSRRLFVKYNTGKCAAQNVGHHTIGAIPCKIATFLKLPNTKEYTDHCLRRTSATLLADSGADILALKRHGGWKSASVTEGYVEESIPNKISIAKKILNTQDEPSNFNIQEAHLNTIDNPEVIHQSVASVSTFSEQLQMSNLSKQGISFPKCTINNPVFHINISNN